MTGSGTYDTHNVTVWCSCPSTVPRLSSVNLVLVATGVVVLCVDVTLFVVLMLVEIRTRKGVLVNIKISYQL